MPIPLKALGRALRRWRAVNRIKQVHAAELLGVNQSTVSRWENGTLPMETEHRFRIEKVVAARLTSAGDRALARLVQHHQRGVHLICDHSHRLLALSGTRRREFGCDADQLIGQSLYPFITEDLALVETRLEDSGWFDDARSPEVVAETGENGSELVPIRPGQCRMTRLLLSDGTAARLVETLP